MGVDRHDSKLIDIYGDKTAKAAPHPRVAYQREIHPRQVTFTCAQCGQEKTQWRYPGAPPRYCSDECQDGARRAKTRERVRRHREKKQAAEASEGEKSDEPAEKTLQVSLWLRVENNSNYIG
ncbi:hypothetical protein [Ktedonobacter racemifer]|uniref:Uncharacterized protein n=1 Tax=Ktedonobacter racemifer DSM 44963 TaxID=485913 RepID=D6U3C3_KTERA|nr:hypothetical protein [Ktedonobacter racemifer]EFH81127.1 hypothetical protein Krac_1818 [Ktedonobacter racemifer DSM 44963]